jgi:hypothetical protein
VVDLDDVVVRVEAEKLALVWAVFGGVPQV